MKKGQSKLLVGVLIIIAVALVIVAINSFKPSSTGNVIKETESSLKIVNSNDESDKELETNSQVIKDDEASLRISDWTIISGWERYIQEKSDNRFNVVPISDALFITTITNDGDILLNDVVETISCNFVSGDRTIINKIVYDGFDCVDGCGNIKTKQVDVFSTSINLGDKIRLEENGKARLNLRFSVDSTKESLLVSEPTSVRCEVAVF